MPKIIENLEEKLIAEARKQIEEVGYGVTTIRSIASGCGVGVGTVYNYFRSKDTLIAHYMLGDWKICLAAIEEVSEKAQNPQTVVRCIFDQLQAFAGNHQAIFRDEEAAAGFSVSFRQYHGLLRRQLAQPLRKFCQSDFDAEFIAEALLTWTSAGKTFDEIYGMIGKIF